MCNRLPNQTFFPASLGKTSGTFKISDSSVQGQGTYYISNGTAEIGLRLVIGMTTRTSKDKPTAIITSLPPNRLGPSGVPGKNGPKLPNQIRPGIVLTPEG